MKVLVLCNDYWHPGSAIIDGLNNLKTDYEFDFYDRVDKKDPEEYKNYDIVILARSNYLEIDDNKKPHNPWMTNKIVDRLTKYVEDGGSLFVIHSGTSEYDEYTKLFDLFGGLFIDHPPQCMVKHTIAKVNSLSHGLNTFLLPDEHYQVDVAGDIDIFLESTSPHSIQPAGWVRSQGKGKVCVVTPGHTQIVWANAEYKKLLINCLKWCE